MRSDKKKKKKGGEKKSLKNVFEEIKRGEEHPPADKVEVLEVLLVRDARVGADLHAHLVNARVLEQCEVRVENPARDEKKKKQQQQHGESKLRRRRRRIF